MKKMTHKHNFIVTLLFAFILMSPIVTFANNLVSEDTKASDETTSPSNTLRHYLGSAVNTGKDNGYSETNKIGGKDPHFGWTLGRFFVNGYTRVSNEENSNPIFLKNVGDKVTLWFRLEQDIDNLNGDYALTISEDENGNDEYFGIEKTNFGRGTLIVRHTDYQNLASDSKVYINYLAANITTKADTKVELFEEGDYEVALNYEIMNSPRKIFGKPIIPTYTNYRIFFRFSVRNGNCMVYPFDIKTKSELASSSITENGFYLDLVKSRYLDINIKKEILKDGAEGMTEDVRFNRPAKDGDRYTEEGLYTITVSNPYTSQQTTKEIYVGTNSVLKAHVTTGRSIKEIQDQLTLGAQIADDGTIIEPSKEITIPSQTPSSAPVSPKPIDGSQNIMIWAITGSILALLSGTGIIAFRNRRINNIKSLKGKNGEIESVSNGEAGKGE